MFPLRDDLDAQTPTNLAWPIQPYVIVSHRSSSVGVLDCRRPPASEVGTVFLWVEALTPLLYYLQWTLQDVVEGRGRVDEAKSG